MKTPTFYTRLPLSSYIIWGIIWFVFTILSFGLLYNVFYSMSIERKYFVNRLILLRWIKSKEFVLPEQSQIQYLTSRMIREYKFDSIQIWIYDKQLNVVLSIGEDRDLIGLFEAGWMDEFINHKIIKAINSKIKFND